MKKVAIAAGMMLLFRSEIISIIALIILAGCAVVWLGKEMVEHDV